MTHNQQTNPYSTQQNRDAGREGKRPARSAEAGKLRSGDYQLRALSKDPDKAVRQLMETLDHLRLMYEKETNALKNGDVQSFMTLQDEKLRTAYQYQADIRDIMDRQETIKSQASQDLLKSIKEKYEDFTKVSEENVDALKRMDKIMGRLSNRLIESAKRAALSDSVSYGATGAIQGKQKQLVSTGVSETA